MSPVNYERRYSTRSLVPSRNLSTKAG
jgi:hypothetical protein